MRNDDLFYLKKPIAHIANKTFIQWIFEYMNMLVEWNDIVFTN